MITKPFLPPKRGYVEVMVDGRHTYRNVETGALIEEEQSAAPGGDIVSWEAMADAMTEGVNEV